MSTSTSSPAIDAPRALYGPEAGSWQERLDAVVAMMREMSQQTDPQAQVRTYRDHLSKRWTVDGFVTLSRRDVEPPRYKITRSSRWDDDFNPWANKDRLPVLEGGLLGAILDGDAPRLINDLHVDPDDPAAEHLEGMRSLMALPTYDGGVALNWTVLLRREPDAFDPEQLPEHVWTSNLFGRATHNLVLHAEVRRTYAMLERELKIVADMQRSLLPQSMPSIPTLGLAAHYQTSQWAGGDYYDFFPLPGGRWGILIADVSGHGTPAAVVMAILHTIAHSDPDLDLPPGAFLARVNERLAARYTTDTGTFVTAFYGIYDPARRVLRYANAGHNPPRLKRCRDGSVASIDGVADLPLGLFPGQAYQEGEWQLLPGDEVVFYTDGITEAVDPSGRMFGLERLDAALENCHLSADGLIRAVLDALDRFTAGAPPTDDRTLLVGKVS